MKNADYRKHNDRTQNSSTYHKKDGTHTRAILKREMAIQIDEEDESSHWALPIVVREGTGTVTDWPGPDLSFTDAIKTVHRVPRFHRGWQSVTYQRKRYQLFGGVHTPYFICLNSPIKGRVHTIVGTAGSLAKGEVT